jgi:putative ABC transport system permease protein
VPCSGAASVFVAVSGVAAALWAQASLDRYDSGPGANGPLEQVLLVVTVGLVLLAVVNAILIAWATATDACLASAVARVLGATPGQVSVGIAAAQAVPALAGAVLGIPAGAALFAILSGPGSVTPSAWWLAVVVLAAVAAVAVLTFIPSRVAGRAGPAPVLMAEG